ncbi:helix-turn-helix transcriptional regulator [Amphibiibacter pelophylacis]|uniref:AlpA family phage regulatory protein n=1 Tax=Amphibiibacter pelophylacis TaxID=1799477 RepID=A0ACC6P567_9BURK
MMQATDKPLHSITEASKGKTLINRRKLLAMIPLSDRTIFNLELRGEFPRRFALTSRNVAWDLAEIEAWIEARKSSGDQARRPGVSIK